MIRSAVLAIALLLAAPALRASESTDGLATCLTGATPKDDRRVLVRWIYSAMSVHPDLRDVSAIDDPRRAGLEADAAKVMERLIADDCATHVRAVLLSDGTDGFSTAFEALGRIAMQDFLEQPDVQRASTAIGSRIDQKRVMKALLSK